jgi:hypothetical protein
LLCFVLLASTYAGLDAKNDYSGNPGGNFLAGGENPRQLGVESAICGATPMNAAFEAVTSATLLDSWKMLDSFAGESFNS